MPAWLKEKGSAIGAVAGAIAAFVAVLQLFVVGPINQRFDAMERHIDQRIEDLTALTNQRFDAQDRRFDAQDQRFDAQGQRFDAQGQRLDRLANEVAELRKLTVSIGERLSRSEGQIEIIREQIKTVDAP